MTQRGQRAWWWFWGRPDGLRSAVRAWLRRRLGREDVGSPGAGARTTKPVPPSAAPAPSSVPSAPSAPVAATLPPGAEWIARGDQVLEGGLFEAALQGQPIVLCRVDGELHAFKGGCPHAGGPLCDGELTGHLIACPWHGWTFNVRTGECEVDPEAPLDLLRCGEADGRVWVSA